MGKTGRFGLGFTLLASALVAIVLLPGCGTSPVAPDNDAPYSYDNGLRGLKFADSLLSGDGGTALAKHGYSLERASNEVAVGLRGGVVNLEFNDASSSWLTIPEGALSKTVTISAQALRIRTRWGEITLFDFHPDGLVFNAPAILTVEVHELDDGEWLRLFWYNPDTRHWEFQQRTRLRNGKVSFEVNHFSKYGIS